MSEFDQKKFNIHVVRVLQHMLEGNVDDKQFADDFGVLCELLWTYDTSTSTMKGENDES